MSAPKQSAPEPARRFSDEDYRNILVFRTRLRRFLAWSGAQARAAGLTPAQHQLLLAVRGHPEPNGPTIRDIANYLQLRHHSAVGLVDRAEAAGLVRRRDDARDRRLARVELEPEGDAALERLTTLHVAELRALTEGLALPEMPPVPGVGELPAVPGATAPLDATDLPEAGLPSDVQSAPVRPRPKRNVGRKRASSG